MTDLREAAQQALEALESLQGGCTDSDDGTVEAITVWCPELIDALRAALAQPSGEPVAYINSDELDNMLDDRAAVIYRVQDGFRKTPLYAAPQPAQNLQPLTDEQIVRCILMVDDPLLWGRMGDECGVALEQFARAIEAAHGIKE